MTALNESIGIIVLAFGALFTVLIPLIQAILKLNTSINSLNALIGLVNKDVKFLTDDNVANKKDIKQLQMMYQDLKISCVRIHAGAYDSED